MLARTLRLRPQGPRRGCEQRSGRRGHRGGGLPHREDRRAPVRRRQYAKTTDGVIFREDRRGSKTLVITPPDALQPWQKHALKLKKRSVVHLGWNERRERREAQKKLEQDFAAAQP
nr:hypothetical protein [uncultured organism]